MVLPFDPSTANPIFLSWKASFSLLEVVKCLPYWARERIEKNSMPATPPSISP